MPNDHVCVALYSKPNDAVEALELLHDRGILGVTEVGIFGIDDSQDSSVGTLRDGYVKEIKLTISWIRL